MTLARRFADSQSEHPTAQSIPELPAARILIVAGEASGDLHGARLVEALRRLAPHCRWTQGAWDQLQWRWNEVQSTGQSISKLTDYLVRLDREQARRGP